MSRDEKAIEQGVISGNVHFGSTVGFPLLSEEEANNSSSFSARYDVDQKTWTIDVSFLKPGIRSSLQDLILVPLCFNGTSEKYTAVNGFNAKFEVTKSTINDYGMYLGIYDSKDGRTMKPRYGEHFDLVLKDVPLDFAKEKKGSISGYCVCDLTYKKPFYDTEHFDATFSSPTEIDMSHSFVCVENLEFWFYDKTTGEVVAKFSLDEAFSKKTKDFAKATEILSLESSESTTVADNSNAPNAESTTSQDEQGGSVASNNGLPRNRNQVGRRRAPAGRAPNNGGGIEPTESTEPANSTAQAPVDQGSENALENPDGAADNTEAPVAENQSEAASDHNSGFGATKEGEEGNLESKIDSFDSNVSQDDEKKLDAEKAFNRNWDVIPESFMGNNCTGLYYAISDRYGDVEKQKTQGEFETTSEFRARMKRVQKDLAQTVISGEVRFGSTVAFPFFPAELESPHFGKIKTQYDANKKRWTLTIDFVMNVGVHGDNNVSWLNIPIYLNGEKETYTGVNGLKMEVEVTKWLFREYGVQAEFPRLKNFKGDYVNGFETLNFILGNVPVDVAKEKKGRVAGFCVCDVDSVEPYFYWFYLKPKFTSPYGFDIFRRFMVVRNLEFWFYDLKTREVFAKYSLDEASRGKIKTYGESTIVAGRGSKVGSPTDEGNEDAEPVPTWEEVLSGAVDSPEKWESKAPTITVPDDAKSLEEALAKSTKGDVILVRATEKPVPLKGKKAARGESSEVKIDHAVAIVGESSESGNVVVEVGSEETLRIGSHDLVAFKGLTFSFRNTPSADAVTPLVVASKGSKAKFKNCVFEGNGIEKSTGIVVEGEQTDATFWKCSFQQFGDAGLRVQDSSKATLEYCQFLSENRYGVSSFSGASAKVDKCRFDGNVTGFIAEGGGGVVASNSFFSGNRSNWSISSGSRDACDTKDGNVVEK